jgi:hypothetical protein
MTIILGWSDPDAGFLCGDSAVTHSQAPVGAKSSFGELQGIDRLTVEERAVKILELPRSVLVGVCGDPDAALRFLSIVRRELTSSSKSARQILIDLEDVAAQQQSDFELQFQQDVDGVPELTAIAVRKSVGEDFEDRIVISGSLPEPKRALASLLVGTVRKHGLPPEARLAGALVALQAMGITEFLPQHGVGGAFFGAYVSPAGVQWQPDIAYLIYPPGEFPKGRIIKPGEAKRDIPVASDVEKVRVLVRDGAGILLSSLGSPRGRVLIPPTSDRSEDDWEKIVLDAVPPPFPLIVPSRHYGFLCSTYRHAVYVFSPTTRTNTALAVRPQPDGRVNLEVAPRLVESLELQTPQGYFDLTLVVESDTGTDAKTYRITMPT